MKREHELINRIYVAKTDPDAADALIRNNMGFIRAETAKFLKRIPIEGKDDELSIAMLAFHEAVQSYDRIRGAFLSYAATAIRNRLIDYYRKESRHKADISTETVIDDSGRTLLDMLDTGHDEIAELSQRNAAKEEIYEYAAELKKFGISLTDVADNSPKQKRTMLACHEALGYMRSNQALIDKMLDTLRLPLAELTLGSGIERKTLERHRKYMVAIILAFTNGFEIIRGHLCRIAPHKEVSKL
ncbi:MAG: sigma-70 family RNA polymerase sigma factor [Eubacteriales bacterium]|nr:sigma-70 family RNA polymerase sigma factor [Clostridia bacterium]MDY5755185.1 sigma-70 family RNA polymerase sigma factor [Eubacteriales bacterium]